MRAVLDTSYAIAAMWERTGDEWLAEVFVERPVVPPLFIAESMSAALKKVRRGTLSPEEARGGLRDLADSVTVTNVVSELLAFETALATGLSLYDAWYLACAQALSLPLWTLDNRLREAAEASGVMVLP